VENKFKNSCDINSDDAIEITLTFEQRETREQIKQAEGPFRQHLQTANQ
jgi:hypothetical protein